MNLLKPNNPDNSSDPRSKKKKPPVPPQNVYYYCNCCGDKFKAGRADGRFCSDICRSAAHSACKNIIMVPNYLTEEEAKRYDQIMFKLQEPSGIIKRVIYLNEGSGIFTQLKKELSKSGDSEIDDKKQLEEEELKLAASKGAKVEPAPKNDKNLIPGKKGQEQQKLIKKQKKAKK